MIPDATWLMAGSNVLGSVLRTPAAAPANSSSYMDSSGWSVNVGSGSSGSAAGGADGVPMWQVLLIALGVGAAVLYIKK